MKLIVSCPKCGGTEFRRKPTKLYRDYQCKNCDWEFHREEMILTEEASTNDVEWYDWTPDNTVEVLVCAQNAFGGQEAVFPATASCPFNGTWYTNDRSKQKNQRLNGTKEVSSAWKISCFTWKPEVPQEVLEGKAPPTPWREGAPDIAGLEALVCAKNKGTFAVFSAFMSRSGMRYWCTHDDTKCVVDGLTLLDPEWEVVCWQPMPRR